VSAQPRRDFGPCLACRNGSARKGYVACGPCWKPLDAIARAEVHRDWDGTPSTFAAVVEAARVRMIERQQREAEAAAL
jgi:hypothetical protein